MILDKLLKQTFSLPEEITIDDDIGPGDLKGWDSLGHVNLVNAIEKTYSISLDLDEMISIETVADIRELLIDKGISKF